jgi:TRAP-type C4-dicarboxylate transport system permease small subunit
MGATSFFALGYALSRNTHIRVEILIAAMGDDRRRAEILSVVLACLIAAGFAFFALKANVVSYLLEEKSQGQDALPVWIPQLVMSSGTIVLLIALVDRLVQLIKYGDEVIGRNEQMTTAETDQTIGRF